MAAVLDTGDTSLMFLCMGLVQFMTPGLAFFYGGLVRSTNILTIMLQSYICLGLVFVLWYLVGFSMSFGESTLGGFVGNPFSFPAFANVGIHEPLMVNGKVLFPDIPGLLFAAYQGMFAVITPALITGAFADRFRLGPYLVFITFWVFVVYAPVCHWVWGGGWMQQWGVWDFAGGIVVHVTSGFSALASLFVLGRRAVPEDGPASLSQPHNVPFVALGTAMLWFGWFGFNGGSALASNGVAVVAAVNSQIAGSVALMGWFIADTVTGKKPGLVGACVGAVAGLATVTPAAGFIQTSGAFIIGIVASIVCYSCVTLLAVLDIDDALDVWGVHGMGGFTGTILVGLLADGAPCGDTPTDAVPLLDCANPGTVTRGPNQVFIQLSCATIVAVYSFTVSFIGLKVIDAVMGIRPKQEHEHDLDVALHGEAAYITHTRSGLTAGGDSDSDTEEPEFVPETTDTELLAAHKAAAGQTGPVAVKPMGGPSGPTPRTPFITGPTAAQQFSVRQLSPRAAAPAGPTTLPSAPKVMSVSTNSPSIQVHRNV